MQGRAGKKPPGSGTLQEPPIPVRQVPERSWRERHEAAHPGQGTRIPGQKVREAVPHRQCAVEVKGHNSDRAQRIISQIFIRRHRGLEQAFWGGGHGPTGFLWNSCERDALRGFAP